MRAFCVTLSEVQLSRNHFTRADGMRSSGKCTAFLSKDIAVVIVGIEITFVKRLIIFPYKSAEGIVFILREQYAALHYLCDII